MISASPPTPRVHRRRGWVIAGAVISVLVIVLVLFDWNWVRPPIERYISRKTEREFRMSDLHVRLGWTPTIRMRDVYFGNAPWATDKAMAQAEMVEFSVSLRDLPDKILVPRVALTRPDLVFERLADDRRNWTLAEPSESDEPSKLRISTLSVDQGRLRYIDHGEPFELDVRASTFDPASREKVKDADAPPVNARYSTEYAFTGKYHDASFSGQALTGEVLSFQESGVPFPLKGRLSAGTTKVEVEGTIADAVDISAIDVRLLIEGRTLANLYPFLLLPLPASPPYRLQGHLTQKGPRYTMEDLSGKIGSTDVTGKGAYLEREPRPLLTADLHSKLLNIADLGPLIGIETKQTGGKPDLSQGETATRPAAKQKDKAVTPDRLLPAGEFEGSRLQKIDADVTLTATKLVVPHALPLESLDAALHLHDSVLKMPRLDFGFAGGKIAGRVTLDAREPTIRADVQVDLQRVRVDRLIPDSKTLAKGAGRLGARLQLQGSGNSIADAAAVANGKLSATIVNGEVSNLLDALSGLNGGKALQLLVGGDRDIVVHCGGVAFDVKRGRGDANLFVIDTEQTQILGEGWFDLAHERFDVKVEPKPKDVGILSLRTPVRLHGSFKQPEFQIEKGPLLARAGGAIALATINPLAALLPLIETGPGENTDCADVQKQVRGAAGQARQPERKR
ncbi:AsmA family protein [Variovorax sp. J22R115]|uniref:AsmA family protein n=1 Tax=Variovorax sp. J22R115 TaxID=3053509 RepID=UPI0025787EAB|nr:AsmA family protein [Variovorax sp. J22R115]MDM0049710.1 AsmA family protein [Variovorax sp. J22R115]